MLDPDSGILLRIYLTGFTDSSLISIEKASHKVRHFLWRARPDSNRRSPP